MVDIFVGAERQKFIYTVTCSAIDPTTLGPASQVISRKHSRESSFCQRMTLKPSIFSWRGYKLWWSSGRNTLQQRPAIVSRPIRLGQQNLSGKSPERSHGSHSQFQSHTSRACWLRVPSLYLLDHIWWKLLSPLLDRPCSMDDCLEAGNWSHCWSPTSDSGRRRSCSGIFADALILLRQLEGGPWVHCDEWPTRPVFKLPSTHAQFHATLQRPVHRPNETASPGSIATAATLLGQGERASLVSTKAVCQEAVAVLKTSSIGEKRFPCLWLNLHSPDITMVNHLR